MRLIQSVSVRGFRSIGEQLLDPVGDLTSLVGKNSSGKSNFLRALNLFFNGQVEPGKELEFTRDYHQAALARQRKQKKRLSIELKFEIPPRFNFRDELSRLQNLGSRFSIQRSWELDRRRRIVQRYFVCPEGGNAEENPALAEQFLDLVTYRYIPNRSIPAEVLRGESQSLATSVFRKVKNQSEVLGPLLNRLGEASARVLRSASESLASAGAPLSAPSIATAQSLGEMILMSGFQARGSHGGQVQDEDWGTGHQSFFLYHVLFALDCDYSRYFGWRQATVWGVEEPESALHRDLETILAGKFREWVGETKARLQIFQTTHSPVFPMASDIGYWCDIAEGETQCTHEEVRQLVDVSERRGVGTWVNPAMAFPWHPVVLVEGKRDAEILSHVAKLVGCHNIRFVPPAYLDKTEETGGKGGIQEFLRKYRSIFANRAAEAPLLALLDWDVSDVELSKAQEAYGAKGTSFVVRMNSAYADARVGPEFRGIERFFPFEVVQVAIEKGELISSVDQMGVLSVSRAQLDRAKGALRSRVLSRTSGQDFTALARVVREIDLTIRQGVSQQLGLTPVPT